MLDNGGVATVIGMIPEGTDIHIDGPSLLSEKKIQGSNMGSNRFRVHMPQYIELYLQGRLKLNELVTKTIKLEDVNQAFEDMKEGHVARSVIVFD
jgi:S-(hydroxymethyl)glutathione dehydrogenase/alcohol dehydrogenase